MVFNNDLSSEKTLFNIFGCYRDDKLFPEDACASTVCGNVLQAKVEAPNRVYKGSAELGVLCSWQSCLVPELLHLSSEETTVMSLLGSLTRRLLKFCSSVRHLH